MLESARQMAPKKKIGYNWKARQIDHTKHHRIRVIELEQSEKPVVLESHDSFPRDVQDVNATILVTRKKNEIPVDQCVPRKKKLSSKQRKRLQKIVQTKEKRTKVSVPFNAHPTWNCIVFWLRVFKRL